MNSFSEQSVEIKRFLYAYSDNQVLGWISDFFLTRKVRCIQVNKQCKIEFDCSFESKQKNHVDQIVQFKWSVIEVSSVFQLELIRSEDYVWKRCIYFWSNATDALGPFNLNVAYSIYETGRKKCSFRAIADLAQTICCWQ